MEVRYEPETVARAFCVTLCRTVGQCGERRIARFRTRRPMKNVTRIVGTDTDISVETVPCSDERDGCVAIWPQA